MITSSIVRYSGLTIDEVLAKDLSTLVAELVLKWEEIHNVTNQRDK